MSEEDLQADAQAPAGESGPEPGTPEPVRLRRRPFGYKRADVDEALETRDSQLVELRQDVAALWLAFAQHDRMIRGLAGGTDPGPAPGEVPDPRPAETGGRAAASMPEVAAAGEEEAAVGKQLSDLDDVLAAIEMATQTLERTYSEEIAEPERAGEAEAGTSGEDREEGGRTSS